MIELRVLGIGSSFGDDQLGWMVVKLLQQQIQLHRYNSQRLQLAYCDRPGMYLLELMRDVETVFLIDAVKTNAVVGTLHCFQNEEIEEVSSALSSHAIGVAQAMQMGKVLNVLPQTVVLYGIEIDDIQFSFDLSTPIEHAIKELALQIGSDILVLLGE